MTSGPDRMRIVIGGNGVAAWMTAAALSRATANRRVGISVVGAPSERAAEASVIAADSTVPTAIALHPALALEEDWLVRNAGAAFSYGTALSEWFADRGTCFRPFGDVGAPRGHVAFDQLLLRMQHDGHPLRLANYSLAALAAQASRFQRPDGDATSVLATCRYGLHVDTRALCRNLRRIAEAGGVNRIDARIRDIRRNDDDRITSVGTADGLDVAGDLFIDATGARAVMRHAGNGGGWHDWAVTLPCDRMLVARARITSAPPPFGHAVAHRGGWTLHLPLQDEIRVASLFNCSSIGEGAVVDSLEKSVTGSLSDIAATRIDFGRCARAWQGNCIAIGSAAVRTDPVGMTNLQLLRQSINYLLQLLPGTPDSANGKSAEALEYNRLTTLLFEHAHDFASMHYKLNGRAGEPFWDNCRAAAMADHLDYRLALYRSRGKVVLYDEEPFDEWVWISLFQESGIMPERYSMLADGFSANEIRAHLDRVRAAMIAKVREMPLHGDYLASISRSNST